MNKAQAPADDVNTYTQTHTHPYMYMNKAQALAADATRSKWPDLSEHEVTNIAPHRLCFARHLDESLASTAR